MKGDHMVLLDAKGLIQTQISSTGDKDSNNSTMASLKDTFYIRDAQWQCNSKLLLKRENFSNYFCFLKAWFQERIKKYMLANH